MESPRRRRANLSLDLSTLPPPTQPPPPSNTLILTNLNSLDLFRPDNLQTIRDLISRTAPIHSFSPLKSFRRIVVSFLDSDAALAVRALWDGELILGERLKIYFGQQTPIQPEDKHLALPDAGKLFFISPPPSPPHGWEVRLEDAPNKMVHAEDLAEALSRLHHRNQPLDPPPTPSEASASGPRTRSRSSTLIYSPAEKGCNQHLPAVVVEDMTDDASPTSPVENSRQIMAHTARPPLDFTHNQ